MNSVVRSRSNSTDALMARIEPLRRIGADDGWIQRYAYGRFPVAGEARFSHDWWFPRYVPTFHLHQGTDIFAAQGTPVRAPFDGAIRMSNGAVGGIAVYVTRHDGTYAYMSHLSGWVEGLEDGQQVVTGDIVGYVGTTGNARGSSPHVHFELHPYGGNPTDPKPYLDQWLAEAELLAAELLGQHAERMATSARVRANAVLAASSGGGHDGFAAPDVARSPAVAWVGAAAPVGATALAERAVRDAARTIDWSIIAEPTDRAATPSGETAVAVALLTALSALRA